MTTDLSSPSVDHAQQDPSPTVTIARTIFGKILGPFRLPDEKDRQAIERAVVGLLEENRGAEERRWQPRVSFVLPAQVCFDRTSASGPDEKSGEESGGSFLVATTDISIEGVGILTWRELPVRHLTLELAGVRFVCEIRWFKRLGFKLYRYGLHFLHLLEEPMETPDDC